MKEYYYLDVRRRVRGPHNIEALAGKLKGGTLGADTEVAAPGDAAWVRLDSIVSAEQVAAAEAPQLPPTDELPAKCPSCGAGVDCSRGGLPTTCTACGRALGAVGFWARLILPLRLYATLSGRATRAEYWGFTLPVWGLIYALIFGGAVLTLAGAFVPGRDVELMLRGDGAVAAGGLLFLLTLMPLTAVQVRRLHDAGFSGYWVGAYLLSSAGYLAAYYFCCWEEWQAVTRSIEQSMLSGDTCHIQSLQMAMKSQASPTLGLLNMAMLMLWLLLFGVSFMDSQRGTNKYGPSAKYPLG